MRITSEVDYALRIMRALAVSADCCLHNGCGGECRGSCKIDAKTISETIGVPPQFTLKILRKLMAGGLVKSYKGMSGGYAIAMKPDDITMRAVVETIDGPFMISKCLSEDYECTRAQIENDGNKDCCYFHRVFDSINAKIAEELDKITLGMAIRGEKPKQDNN
ncbi:MAG: Rrf2 family transcriptional regulator [Eubacteriales bacterium]